MVLSQATLSLQYVAIGYKGLAGDDMWSKTDPFLCQLGCSRPTDRLLLSHANGERGKLRPADRADAQLKEQPKKRAEVRANLSKKSRNVVAF
jgi:hypothetical protein